MYSLSRYFGRKVQLGPANRRQKLGLVWRNRKKISQIINDYLCLPFFLLIILWEKSSTGQNKVFPLFLPAVVIFSADRKSFLTHFKKRAFFYNTVFMSFFEEKCNIFMLDYRLAEKNWSGSTVKERRELPAKSHIGVQKSGATGGRGNSSIIKARNPFFWSKVKWC